MGSEVRVSSSISAVSTVARIAVAMVEDGAAGVHLLEQVEHFFDALVAGRCGHE